MLGRISLLLIALVVLSSGTAHSGWCGKSDAENWKEFSSLFWAGPTRDTGKPVIYFVVSPWCPYCAELAKRLRSRESKFEPRFIPVDGKSALHEAQIADIATDGTLRSIDRTFIFRSRPKNKLTKAQLEFVSEVHQVVYQALITRFKRQVRRWGTPMTLLYDDRLQGNQLRFSTGMPLLSSYDQIGMSSRSPSLKSLTRDFIRRPVPRESSVRGIPVASTRNVRLRVLPHDASLTIHCFQQGMRLKASGIVKIKGIDWLVFRPFTLGKHMRIYGRADQFAGWRR